MTATVNADHCPCGSGHDYGSCCAPYLVGTAVPATPEALMRSRYTAFCEGNVDYLLATHHPDTRQPNDRQTLRQTVATTEWLSLHVLSAAAATVVFVAFFREGSGARVGQLHERSAFVREADRWYYRDGELLPPHLLTRNDRCWCGSGKKLKSCHRKNP